MRRPGPPPIEGLEPLELIGRGGSAEVYTYRQVMPPRTVAVKVLHASTASSAHLVDEAVVMAELSQHPSIVTIHQAGESEDGRRYLVMEYCSRPNLARRYRSEPLGLPEVLSLGVRLAAAVETAHRAGVLHRDIKPANVLVTDFGWPALADFGIASSHVGSSQGDSGGGMSLLWAAPEALEDPAGADERSDVYSLGATLYTLLAGHAPHERGPGRTEASVLIDRILREPAPPLGRSDVSASLEAVLARAMARDREERYPSAADLGRALQAIERDLGLPATELTLSPGAGAGAGAGTGDASSPLAGGAPPSDWDTAAVVAATRRLGEGRDRSSRAGAATPPSGAATTDSTPGPRAGSATGPATGWTADPTAPTTRPGHTTMRRFALGVAAAIAAILVVAWSLSRVSVTPEVPDATVAPAPALTAGVPAPTEVVLTWEGSDVVATWVNPSPQEGDRYSLQVELDGAPSARTSTTETTTRIPSDGVAEVCLQVAVVRADGATSRVEVQCAP